MTNLGGGLEMCGVSQQTAAGEAVPQPDSGGPSSPQGGVCVMDRDTWFPLCLLQAECHWSRLPGLLVP